MDDLLAPIARLCAPRHRPASALLAVLLLASTTPKVAPASPFSTDSLSTSQSNGLGEWPAFIAGGRAVWTTQPPPPIMPQVVTWLDNSVFVQNASSTPLVQYLDWRRGLDPSRFDFWHPQLGPELANLPPPTTAPHITTMSQLPMVPKSRPSPQLVLPPPHTPEPTSALIALAMLAAAGRWRRSVRARRASCPRLARAAE